MIKRLPLNFSNATLRLTLLMLIVCGTLSVHAQISLTATGGTTIGSYTTLKGAFDAINAGTHTGTISILVTGNTSETASCVLNASGTGSASYTRVTINPDGGATRTITGSVAGDLIDLSGADNVKIDGLNTGGNALTIANSNTGTTASAIRFINDAQSDTVTNCTVTSSHTSAAYGTIVFGISTGGSGNDNNAITNCVVAETGSNLPAVGIYCNGTATAGQENSGITIAGCSIANYFNAGIVTNGILVSAGATNWTITGNKFFQSASRTFTTANTHNAISIQAGNAHVVSFNTIGYASDAGTGTYTLAGTIATRFIGILLNVGTTTASSVQGNTVTAISVTTSSGAATANGVLCGIAVTGGNVNIGTVTGNTLGSTTGTAALAAFPSTTQGAVVGINSASTGVVNIQNNTMGGFSSTSATASIAGGVFGITVSAAATSMTISDNIIGNTTATNMVAGVLGTTTGTSIGAGINLASTPITATISNNTIQNFATYGTGTGYIRGIVTATSVTANAVWTISNNTVRNLTTTGAATNISSGLCAVIGIHSLAPAVVTINNNTIYNIGYAGAATTNIIATGISLAGASATIASPNRVYNNIIYGVTNTGASTTATAPPIAAGISIRSGNNGWYIYNNMISLGAGQSTNTAFTGIYGNHGSTPNPVDYIYNNTVNIEGTVTSGALASSCFNRGDYSTSQRAITVEVRNNIFNNTRTGGTGKHYAISENLNATATLTGWASNNNILNSAAAGTVGYWGADRDMAAWKSNSGGDAASYTGAVLTFVNSASDLHLNMGTTPTLVESNGQNMSAIYTGDFDGQTRPGPTGSVNGGAFAYDIGADEIDGVYLDNIAPTITYAPITNTTSTANRTFTGLATVTDGQTGVNTTTAKPRLYFKKATDANTFGANTSVTNGWKWVEATNASSPFNFVIDYSIINGGSVSSGDAIQYFIVAQDNYTTPNVGANPSAGFTATSVSNITSAPTVPANYNIVAPLATTLSVGSGQPYTSLTGTGGLFEAINASALGGNTTVSITSDLTEDGSIALSGGGMAGYTLTLVSSTNTVRVISNSANLSQAMIRLDGAVGVNFDGRVNGSGQYLRIVNTNTTSANGMAAIQLANGATNTVLQNCIIETNTSSATQASVVMGAGTNSLIVKGCDLRDAQGTPGTAGVPYAAIYSNNALNSIVVGGSTATDGNNIYNFTNNGVFLNNIADGAIVRYNNIYQTTGRSTPIFNVYVGAGNNHTLRNNNIYQTAGTLSGTGYVGIYVVATGNGHDISENSIGGSNANRTGAAITITTATTSPYFMSGIFLTGGTGAASSIQGNYISNMANMFSGSGGQMFGINVTAGNANIGTINGNIIGGGLTPSDTLRSSYDNGYIQYGGTGTVDIQNNLIGNGYYDRASPGGDRNAGIYISAACLATIKNNTVRDIRSNSTSSGATTFNAFGILVNGALLANSVVEGNTVYNIENTNTGTAAYAVSGIRFTTGSAAGVTIQRNKVYNIRANGTGTGTNAPEVQGIYLNAASNALNIINNQIAIGAGATGETRVYGIYDNTAGNHNYHYNTVYVSGNNTAGVNNSYCFYRASTGLPNMRNNIFYNTRTSGGTGITYAIGSASAGLGATNLNYNLAIVPDTAKLVEMPTGTANGWSAIGTLYTSIPNSNVVDLATNVPATALFNAPAAFDLNINANNAACWYANGRGVQLAGITTDFGNAGAVRSTTVAGGGTDIGADEFTPAVPAPDVVVTGSHTNGGTETLISAGRTVATITWGATGTLPAITSFKYWPGTNPNDTTNNGTKPNAKTMNAYWSFDATGGSGYTYDLTLYYDEALLGTIPAESAIRLSQRTAGVNGSWIVNGTGTVLNSTANTMAVTGLANVYEFTGSDVANPLPVVLMNFNASRVKADVNLTWQTASETNNSKFVLERSTDMNRFVAIGEVKGKGNSNTVVNYAYLDKSPFGSNRTLYYRLMQVDVNGDKTYSNVVAVNLDAEGKGAYISQLSPNPFNQNLNITLEQAVGGNTEIRVYDLTGKVVYTNSQVTDSGTQTITLPALDGLANGVYILEVNNASQTMRQRVVKAGK